MPADDLLALAKGGSVTPQAVIYEESKDEWIAFSAVSDAIFSPAAKQQILQEQSKALLEDYEKNKPAMLVVRGLITDVTR